MNALASFLGAGTQIQDGRVTNVNGTNSRNNSNPVDHSMFRKRARRIARSGGTTRSDRMRREEFDAAAEIRTKKSELDRDGDPRVRDLRKRRDELSETLVKVPNNMSFRRKRVALQNNIVEIDVEIARIHRECATFSERTEPIVSGRGEADAQHNLEQQCEAVITKMCGRKTGRPILVHSDYCVRCQVPLAVNADKGHASCPQCGIIRKFIMSAIDMQTTEKRIWDASSEGKSASSARSKRGVRRTRPKGHAAAEPEAKKAKTELDAVVEDAPSSVATSSVTPRRSRGGGKDRVAQYATFLRQFSADVSDPPPEVIERVLSQFSMVHMHTNAKIRQPSVSQILRDDLSQYAFMSLRIVKIVTGQRVPTLPADLIDRMVTRYSHVIQKASDMDDDSVKKMLNPSHTTRQLLYMENRPDLIECFETHKTRDVLLRDDIFFKHLCETMDREKVGDMSWPYRRTA